MSISRRAFLGAAALTPLGAKAFAAPGKLPTRAFGATGVQVPLLAFGCGSRFLAYKDDDEAVGVLSRAIDLGFTYIDTAHYYGDGKSEERDRPAHGQSPRARSSSHTKLAARKGDEAQRQLEAEPQAAAHRPPRRAAHPQRSTSPEDLAAIEAPDGVLKALYSRHASRRSPASSASPATPHPAAMQAALERHDFDCMQMALNAARARMSSTTRGDEGHGPDGRCELRGARAARGGPQEDGRDRHEGLRAGPARSGRPPPEKLLVLRAVAAGQPGDRRHAEARAPRAQRGARAGVRPARRRPRCSRCAPPSADSTRQRSSRSSSQTTGTREVGPVRPKANRHARGPVDDCGL